MVGMGRIGDARLGVVACCVGCVGGCCLVGVDGGILGAGQSLATDNVVDGTSLSAGWLLCCLFLDGEVDAPCLLLLLLLRFFVVFGMMKNCVCLCVWCVCVWCVQSVATSLAFLLWSELGQ